MAVIPPSYIKLFRGRNWHRRCQVHKRTYCGLNVYLAGIRSEQAEKPSGTLCKVCAERNAEELATIDWVEKFKREHPSAR